MLMAAKWVGNVSTHGNGAPFRSSDLLDTPELVEVALGIIYAPSHSALLDRARRINQA